MNQTPMMKMMKMVQMVTGEIKLFKYSEKQFEVDSLPTSWKLFTNSCTDIKTVY